MRTPTLLWLPLAAFVTAVMPLAVLAKAQEQQASQEQAQPGPLPDQDSVANAAVRSRAAADKSGLRRVYTEDDVSSLQGPVSVVGEDKNEPAAPNAQIPGAKPPATGQAKSPTRAEAYWRGRYQALRGRLDAVDRQIADVQEQIKKYGNGGASAEVYPTPGLPGKNECVNVTGNLPGYCDAIMNNRLSELEYWKRMKAEFQSRIDQLQDEARKAGAEPGWLR